MTHEDKEMQHDMSKLQEQVHLVEIQQDDELSEN